MKHKKIAFIGAGNMSRSIITGMVQQGYPPELIIASNPSQGKLDALAQTLSIAVTQDNAEAVTWADVVVLAVKPQLMAVACDQFNHLPLQDTVFISIAAGLTVARLHQMLKSTTPLIRTMPNTPSAIGLGMTGLYASDAVHQDDKIFAGQLMSMVGKIIWVEKEEDIDAVIAAAGSSPAYFFLFLEAMDAITQKYGFSATESRAMVQQAMLGAAQLVVNSPDTSLSDLRQQVTSKGGATAEAIRVFQEHDLPATIEEAMGAAIARSQSLSKQL